MDSPAEKVLEERRPQERSGHTAVLDGNLLYVWGGFRVDRLRDSENVTKGTCPSNSTIPDKYGADVKLPSYEIWLYDLEQCVWKKIRTTGDIPPRMSGSCGCFLNGHMYIFGGCDHIGQTNQIYCINLTDGEYAWTKIIHKMGSAPSPRDNLSCWIHKGSIIYFGGYGEKPVDNFINRQEKFILDDSSWLEVAIWGWNNEVHKFDPVHNIWTEPQTYGRAPCPRDAHASAALGCKGYICGGKLKGTKMSDMHCLDLNSWTWSEIVPTTPTPVSRSWHTLTAVSDNSLFLFGGLGVDCIPLSDGWMFDAEPKKWREVKHCFAEKPRLRHTACMTRDSDVIVFGGSSDYVLDNSTGHCNDVLVCQIQPYSLFRICEDYIIDNLRIHKVLRNQLTLLPPLLLTAIHRRIPFYI